TTLAGWILIPGSRAQTDREMRAPFTSVSQAVGISFTIMLSTTAGRQGLRITSRRSVLAQRQTVPARRAFSITRSTISLIPVVMLSWILLVQAPSGITLLIWQGWEFPVAPNRIICRRIRSLSIHRPLTSIYRAEALPWTKA